MEPHSARARRIARSREEMMGLLADFSAGGGEEEDSDRELSFSDLVEAIGQPSAAADHVSKEEKEEEDVVASAKRQAAAAAMAGKEVRRLRRRRSNGRGSGGGDGVLLNFYVPGLLSRSMTAPRSGRGALPTAAAASSGAGHGVPARAAAGKSRMQAPLAIGCWPALWGRGRDHRNKPV